MRKLFAAGIAIACAMPGGARADWVYTKWGMTPEQVAAASGNAVQVIPKAERKQIQAVSLEMGAIGDFADGDLRMNVSFGFDKKTGGLVTVVYGVDDGAQNATLKTWMVKTFGPPQTHSGLPGALMETMGWRNNDVISLMIVGDAPAIVTQDRKK